MATDGGDTVKVVPVRHYGRWAGGGVAAIFIVMLVHTMLSKVPDTTGQMVCHVVNGHRRCQPATHWRFYWNVVGQYFTTSEVLHGLLLTLELTALAMIIGIVLGLVLAVMRLSHSRLLSATAWSYTWFFRGTPVLVQLAFWFYIHALYANLSIGLPFLHVTFVTLNVNSIDTAFFAAMIALGTNEAAYFSEIARSGLIAVDEGQTEAASSLGMTRAQTLRLVVLPQAMRVILPPTGNEVISMLKTSSLAMTISVVELYGATSNISAGNFEIMPLLIVASMWYLIVTTVLSIGQYYLERHYSRGALRTPPPTPIQRIRADVRGILSKFRTKRGVQVAVTP
jgi:polar amino acid transport system permease protein